ncbi:MAG: hypothetical protein GX418_02920 [Clostridiales bacterium]|nr:hypothetical protein [Clostridiales bacterium]
MLVYTLLKGRGKLHAYNFSASTATLPYAAPWAADIRATDTRGNRPVVELQASDFGKLILIQSQYVKDYGRDFGITQYVHAVPEAGDLARVAAPPGEPDPGGAGGKPAGETEAMAWMAPNLLFYKGFLTPGAFLELDNRQDVLTRMLAEERVALPAVPDGAPPACEDGMLGELLCELWKNCYFRLRGGVSFTPVRVTVCPAQQAERTLEWGLLFLAKTALPRLPRSVWAILSVTVGAQWEQVVSYKGTACCIAQPSEAEGFGFDLPSGRFGSRLGQEEKTLAHALATGEEMPYYREMERQLGVCPLCADYRIALYLTSLHRYLHLAGRTAEDLDNCATLWQELRKIILRDYASAVDAQACRRLLLPVETDILQRQAEQSRERPIPSDIYWALADSAFSVRGELAAEPKLLEGMLEAYAHGLALPPVFSDAPKRPYLEFLRSQRCTDGIRTDPDLFVRSLQAYLNAYGLVDELDAKAPKAILSRIRQLPDPAGVRNSLIAPCVLTLARGGAPQRVVNEVYDLFQLNSPQIRAETERRYLEALADGPLTSEQLNDTLAFFKKLGDLERTIRLLDALDERFAAAMPTRAEWTNYLMLCLRYQHVGQTPVRNAFAYLQRTRNGDALPQAEFDTLTKFCLAAGDPVMVEDAIWRYYAAVTENTGQGEEECRQMTDLSAHFPGLFRRRPDATAWKGCIDAKIRADLNRELDGLRTWDALTDFPHRWAGISATAYAEEGAWTNLPLLFGAEPLRRAVEEACRRVLQSEEPLPLPGALDRARWLTEADDWYGLALRSPVLQAIRPKAREYWDTARTTEQTHSLRLLMRTVGRLSAATGGNSPWEPEIQEALRLLGQAEHWVETLQGLHGSPETAPRSEARALIAGLAACPEAGRVTALLRDRYGETLASLPFEARFAVCCLLNVSADPGACIRWNDALGMIDGRLGRGTLSNLHPWSGAGLPVLRLLLLCLRESDGIVPATDSGALWLHLQTDCPRLTREARVSRLQYAHLRSLYGAGREPDMETVRRRFGENVAMWLFQSI